MENSSSSMRILFPPPRRQPTRGIIIITIEKYYELSFAQSGLAQSRAGVNVPSGEVSLKYLLLLREHFANYVVGGW